MHEGHGPGAGSPTGPPASVKPVDLVKGIRQTAANCEQVVGCCRSISGRPFSARPPENLTVTLFPTVAGSRLHMPVNVNWPCDVFRLARPFTAGGPRTRCSRGPPGVIESGKHNAVLHELPTAGHRHVHAFVLHREMICSRRRNCGVFLPPQSPSHEALLSTTTPNSGAGPYALTSRPRVDTSPDIANERSVRSECEQSRSRFEAGERVVRGLQAENSSIECRPKRASHPLPLRTGQQTRWPPPCGRSVPTRPCARLPPAVVVAAGCRRMGDSSGRRGDVMTARHRRDVPGE